MKIPGQEQAGRNLINWAEKDDEWASRRDEIFDDHFDPVMEDHDFSPDELPDLLGPGFVGLYGFMIEDFFSARFEGDLNIVDCYFERHGWRETVPARRYFEAIRDSSVSLYEVVDLDPGRTMTVRDLIRDDAPVVVEEESGSLSAAPWDCIAARILVLGGKPIFTGGVLPFDRDAAGRILRQFDKALGVVEDELLKMDKKEKRETTRDSRAVRNTLPDLLSTQHNVAKVFTTVWLDDALGRALAPPPELQNTDGETYMFCDTFFPVKASEGEVAAVLDGIDDLYRNPPDELEWIWLTPRPSRSRSASKRGGKTGADVKNAVRRTVLGTLSLESGKLALSTNSQERSERGQALLAEHLGERVGPPLTSHRTPQQALDERSQTPPKESVPPVAPEEARQAMRIYLDDHYRSVLDEPVPMLGEKTPRQAASTKDGRAQVVDWLKMLENAEYRRAANSGGTPYDTRWIWKELGIKYPRH